MCATLCDREIIYTINHVKPTECRWLHLMSPEVCFFHDHIKKKHMKMLLCDLFDRVYWKIGFVCYCTLFTFPTTQPWKPCGKIYLCHRVLPTFVVFGLEKGRGTPEFESSYVKKKEDGLAATVNYEDKEEKKGNDELNLLCNLQWKYLMWLLTRSLVRRIEWVSK